MMTREARCQKYFESKSSAFKICRGFRNTLGGVSAIFSDGRSLVCHLLSRRDWGREQGGDRLGERVGGGFPRPRDHSGPCMMQREIFVSSPLVS